MIRIRSTSIPGRTDVFRYIPVPSDKIQQLQEQRQKFSQPSQLVLDLSSQSRQHLSTRHQSLNPSKAPS